MTGVPVLREAIAAKIEACTAAATTLPRNHRHRRRHPGHPHRHPGRGAPGDEVIVLEPCYDSYVPNIELAGGTVVRVPLTPGTFRPDFDKIAAAITPKTRAILINSPHNPSGTVWSPRRHAALQDLLAPTDVLLISDEVYEHMVFDGQLHHERGALTPAWPRAPSSSVQLRQDLPRDRLEGRLCGRARHRLTAEFRKVHQFNVFTVNTPMQHGLASYMADPAPYLNLPAFYQRKRDLFRAGLANTKFRLLPCEGTYFQCVDISTWRARARFARSRVLPVAHHARSAWPRFRCRRSTATASTRRWSGSALPNGTTP
jgi:methionine aminotransferase